jgi:hypothetical protein
MFRRIRYKQVLLGGVAALALAAPSSALAGSSPLLAQSQALNARYGNAVTALSSKEFNELYKDGGSKMSPQALNALMTRSQKLNSTSQPSSGSGSLMAQSRALNARYGNAVTALSSKEFIDLYKDGGSKMSPQALNALVTEGQALDARGIPSSPTITIDNPGFQWGDFGLGAAVAAAAMILLALSMRFVNRREQQGRPSTASR